MGLQDIKETKRYRRTHRRTDNVKTVYPPPLLKLRFGGGINSIPPELCLNGKIFPLIMNVTPCCRRSQESQKYVYQISMMESYRLFHRSVPPGFLDFWNPLFKSYSLEKTCLLLVCCPRIEFFLQPKLSIV